MPKRALAFLLLAILPTCSLADEKDYTRLIKKAVEKSTLNQARIAVSP